MDRWDVIIVGAGPGGLAAALLLARAGLRVKICERLDRPGGRTSAIESDGFRFDQGPTFFLYPRILEEIFAEAGRDLWTEVPMVRLDPHYRLMFGAGGTLDATADAHRMREEIRRLCPRDAAAFERFMTDNRRKLAEFRPILESACPGWRNFAHPRWLKLLPLMRPWLSLDGDLRRHFSDPRIRLAFSFQSKYLGMSPFRCPSLFSILSFLEYEHGVYHPYGGCAGVSERMAEIAAEMGVTISLGRPVEEILFQGRRAVGVRTADGVDRCETLVINADFARAMHRLVPDRLRKNWSNQAIQRKQFSCSTFMLYLGLDGRYDDLPHHTIYIARDYERNLGDIETRHVLSADPSIYVQNATVTDPSLAPQGQSTLYVLAPVTHQHANVNWAVERARFREVVLSQLERQLGLTDLRKRIRFERICTPADWDAGHEIHLGATFNLAHTLKQMLHLRPQNRFGDLDGVYLVGGGTHPGSGLPVIYESARITSRLLLADLGRERSHTPLAAPVRPADPVRQLATVAWGES